MSEFCSVHNEDDIVITILKDKKGIVDSSSSLSSSNLKQQQNQYKKNKYGVTKEKNLKHFSVSCK